MINFLGKFRKIFYENDIIKKLILIQLSVFILLKLILVFNGNKINFISYLGLTPKILESIIFFWKWIAFPFIHIKLQSLIISMVGIYLFGKVYTTYKNQSEFLWLFFLSSIASGIVYVILSYLFISKHNLFLITATPSIFGIAVASTRLYPSHKFNFNLFGKIDIQVFTIVYIVISLFLTSNQSNIINISYLSGGLFGFIYAYQISKGFDIIYWLKRQYMLNFKYKEKKSNKKNNENDKKTNENDKKINEIIQKIAKSGYQSLSQDEKEYFFKNNQP